ncbi:hypothetical protein C7271_06995 [filamentous cyanobacterium CCP5]|nr:hypothetical protein C7271_06995 [filamentous cyanobacterium CCP5]
MLKFSIRPAIALLAAGVALVLIGWSALARSASPMDYPASVPSLIATAPAPPVLVPAILNGEPIQVLYITRAEDTVLVRCYPGYTPTLSVRAMGPNPAAEGQKEGVLTCAGD